jgi:hypothetical protein
MNVFLQARKRIIKTMHKREGNYILISIDDLNNYEGNGWVWVHNDTEVDVSPIFEESDEAEFWMFENCRKLDKDAKSVTTEKE